VLSAPVRRLGCAATRRSPALTGLRVDGSWVSPSSGTSCDAPGRGAGPVPGNLARSESASDRGGGVSAGLLHFPAGNAARWRHQAHRIIEAGPGASSAAAARWPARGARASRARTRLVVSGKRPKPKLRGSFPSGGIATPAAQQASAKCSSAADTPAAASRRRIATRRRTARRGRPDDQVHDGPSRRGISFRSGPRQTFQGRTHARDLVGPAVLRRLRLRRAFPDTGS
jgi:hypothetical protein